MVSGRLSAEIRDLYGNLIDGMQGVRGQIRSGGDEGAQLQGSPPTGPPVALYSGIVTVGQDGNAEVAFDVPDFSGSLRVMAVAWSKNKIGHATTDVIVRDPVVLTATLPRFLLPNDRSTMHLDLDNVEGQAGDYAIAVTTADAVTAGAGANQTARVARQTAWVSDRSNHRYRGRERHCADQRYRAGRFCARSQLCVDRQATGANPRKAYGEVDREGR